MNKILTIVTLIIFSTKILGASDGSHSFYLSSTRNLQIDNSVFLDIKNPDYAAWSTPYNKFVWEGGYLYGLSEILCIGLQLEVESIQFDNYEIGGNAKAEKIAAGFHFEASYPVKPLHLTGGGFANLGKVKSTDFNFNLTGFEYGMYLGPELEIQKIKVSFLIKPRFGYYTSGGEDAESLLLLYPGLTFRLKYEF